MARPVLLAALSSAPLCRRVPPSPLRLWPPRPSAPPSTPSGCAHVVAELALRVRRLRRIAASPGGLACRRPCWRPSARTRQATGLSAPSHVPTSSARICARPLDAAFTATAARSQSPTAITASGRRPWAACTAAATAHVPKSSAAGMDRVGIASGAPCWRLSARRSAVGAPPRWSALVASAGNSSETSQTTGSPPSSPSKAYPPTPSTLLTSVMTVSTPSCPTSRNTNSGASGTPSLSRSSAEAASNSSTHSSNGLPLGRRHNHSPSRRWPFPAPASAAQATA
eukprot:6211721-Pleurochrysis_carterae.AAC.3